MQGRSMGPFFWFSRNLGAVISPYMAAKDPVKDCRDAIDVCLYATGFAKDIRIIVKRMMTMLL